MSINPSDFLTTAKNLASSDNVSEADQRSAISRSYYGMYHKVLSILDNEPRNYEGKGCHGNLICYLQSDAAHEESIDHRSLKRLSYQLKQSRDSRVLADYELEKEISDILVKTSIKTAEKCFDLAEEVSGEQDTASSA